MRQVKIPENFEVQVQPYSSQMASVDLDHALFELDEEIQLASSQADRIDCFLAAASGLLCGALDIIWVGDFSLDRAREQGSKQIDAFVLKVANLQGYGGDDLAGAVNYLGNNFPMASDGNMSDFGGGLQHHLRDFSHHASLSGLLFSLLTQFTGKSYGTDKDGRLLIVDVPEKYRELLGDDLPSRLYKGIVVWFFHLVSDMAGSASTAGLSGGTGIPGPILSLAKTLSALPLFKSMKPDGYPISQFLSKLFNGTLLAEHDEKGRIIPGTQRRFDFRAEFGIAEQGTKQMVPVIANECIIRAVCLARRLGSALMEQKIGDMSDLKKLSHALLFPEQDPSFDRMLTISTGVFMTVDITDAMVRNGPSHGGWLVRINYPGVGRFAVALGNEYSHFLKRQKLNEVKEMYEEISRNTYRKKENYIYDKLGTFAIL